MQNTSQLYKNILSSPHYKEVKLEVYSADGQTSVGTFGMDKLTEMLSEKSVFQNDVPSVGGCVSGKFSVSFYPTDNQGNSVAIPKAAMLKPFVRLVDEDGGQSSEWLQKGVYFVDTRSVNRGNGVLTLNGYDAIVKTEADYPSDDTAQYPATDTTVLSKIARAIGVPVDERTFDYITGLYRISHPVGYSMREVLSGIAASYGCNFIVSYEGKLLAVPLEAAISESVAEIGYSAKKISISDPVYGCSKVIINIDENNFVEAGDNTGNVIEFSCFWGTQAMAMSVLNALSDWEYQPFSCTSATIDPAFEIGDSVFVGGAYSYICNQSIVFDSLFAESLSAPNETEAAHEFAYTPKATREYKRTLQQTQSEIQQNAEQIALKVSSAEAQTLINQTVENISLTATGNAGTTTFVLKSGSATIDTETVDLQVKSVNISGKLTASQIDVSDLRAFGATIGGWTISTDSINKVVTNSCRVYLQAPVNTTETSRAIVVQKYENDTWVQKFAVTYGGKLTAVDVDLSGKITATSGTIGGCQIENGVLKIPSANITGTIAIGQIPQSVLDDISAANLTEQTIYRSAERGTSSMSGTATWVTNATGNQNGWTIKRPVYSSDYPVLFVATQRKSVEGTVTCTTPLIDNTTTVIDGGHITTGSIDANLITTGTLSSDRLDANTITVKAANISGSLSASQIDVSDLRAFGATIGGWTIATSSINKVVENSCRVYLQAPSNATETSRAIVVQKYENSEWVQKFAVTYGGKLTAVDVDLSGKITATSGTIGGVTISNGTLSGLSTGNMSTGVNTNLGYGAAYGAAAVQNSSAPASYFCTNGLTVNSNYIGMRQNDTAKTLQILTRTIGGTTINYLGYV